MTSTPPPPRRIHTPPTPLHGPKYDNYEPYSPRKSTRIAQKAKGTPSPRFNSSPLNPSFNLISTPSNHITYHRTRSTNQTFSPPSSPNSPSSKLVLVTSPKASQKRAKTTKHPRNSPLPASDSDTDILPENEAHRLTSSKKSFGMLQTPSKTPRKRADAKLTGAARLLFGESDTIAAPTPKKVRKAKLDQFALMEDDGGQGQSSKIEIYTDSKDRVPALDEDDNNPFLTKNAAKPGARSKSKKKSSRDMEMEQAAKADKGMVYVFRGKKHFRKFEDSGHDGEDAEDEDNLSDVEVRRKAGAGAARPFLRSSIKPRLLFPSEQSREIREEEDEADEEAVTDIEMPKPADATTPTKEQHHVHLRTPPTTVRTKRTASATDSIPGDVAQLQDEMLKSPSSASLPSKPKKRSPFASYPRKKTISDTQAPKSVKRGGSPLIREGETGKRTRSGTHS